MIKILELFGGIGSPRCAMRNIGIPVKAIDYVEIDEKAVRSYNAMFSDELEYKTQSVVGWNLKPDILIHGSPCQDFSIAGHQGKATAEAGRINRGKGADKGSGTRSSLMWETIHIIEQMGEWKPKYVIWENVKNVLSRYMRVNFNRYLSEMERLGYSNNFEVLDAREFGLPQARERVFTVSVLGNEKFSFDDLIKTPMRDTAFIVPIEDKIGSQLGAFEELENAKKACKEGYTVYDWDGKAVYSKQTTKKLPYKVQIDVDDLRIRTGAGIGYAVTGEYTGRGVFTIVEEKAGKGSTAGWGKLKSGAGWVSLDYCTKLV